MAASNQYSTAGLLPSATLQPYGQNILKYGIGQLGTPIDVGKLTPQVAGQTAFQQQAQQGFNNQGTLFGNQGALFNMQNQQNLTQQGLAGAYGNQINQQFGLSDFNRQGMGQDINALGSIGAINQAQEQAKLNADAQAAQTGAYESYGRLGQYGNALTGLAGGVAGQQYQEQEAADPYASALSGAMGVAGLFGQIYGGRNK